MVYEVTSFKGFEAYFRSLGETESRMMDTAKAVGPRSRDLYESTIPRNRLKLCGFTSGIQNLRGPLEGLEGIITLGVDAYDQDQGFIPHAILEIHLPNIGKYGISNFGPSDDTMFTNVDDSPESDISRKIKGIHAQIAPYRSEE